MRAIQFLLPVKMDHPDLAAPLGRVMTIKGN
jgi:hypothetical protein